MTKIIKSFQIPIDPASSTSLNNLFMSSPLLQNLFFLCYLHYNNLLNIPPFSFYILTCLTKDLHACRAFILIRKPLSHDSEQGFQ